MSVFAPASVSAPPGTLIPGVPPGSSPTQPLSTGAEARQSFESALADLLALNRRLGEATPKAVLADEIAREIKPKSRSKPGSKEESETLLTGVDVIMPAPVPVPPQALAFEPALPALLAVAAGSGEIPSSQNRETGTMPVMAKLAPGLVSVPAPKPGAAAPSASDGGEAALPIAMPAARAAVVISEVSSASELPHAAFAERFTPTAMPDSAAAQSFAAAKHDPGAAGKMDVAPPAPEPAPAARAGLQERTSERRQEGRDGDTRNMRDGTPAQPAAPDARDIDRGEPSRMESPAAIAASARAPLPAPRTSPAAETRPGEIRPAEVDAGRLQALPDTHNADAHAISLRLSDGADQRVELKITDQAGEVKVVVRTADPNLAGSLRENLGDLVHKLEQSGLRADSWHPGAAGSVDGPRQTRHAESESFGGEHSGGRQQSDGRERRQQQPHPEGARWLEEFETSFASDSERSTTIWPPA